MGTYSKLLQSQQSPSPTSPEKTKVVSKKHRLKEKPPNINASMQANKHASIHAYLQASMLALLNEKASYAFTFRYPPELLDVLEDTLHRIKKRHKVKLSKNSVAVASLIFLLSDYEAFGKESVFYQMLIEQPE